MGAQRGKRKRKTRVSFVPWHNPIRNYLARTKFVMHLEGGVAGRRRGTSETIGVDCKAHQSLNPGPLEPSRIWSGQEQQWHFEKKPG